MTRPRVSLTMIVRDEEHNLPACLGPVAGLFGEVVVVDTGSADRTREVAAGLGARVFDVPWADSFAAARNAALDRATGGWAVRLDADDRLDPPEVERLRAALAALPDRPAGLTVRYRHDLGNRAAEIDEVRVFPNRPDVRWVYRVHEGIAAAVEAAGGVLRPSGVALRHEGLRDPALVRRKLERNRRLLELDRADRPADPFVLFYLGWTLLDLGDPGGAAEALAAACRAAPPGFGLLARCHALLARARQGRWEHGAALAAVRAGLSAAPRDAELGCLEGELLLAAGDAGAAAARFRDLLAGGWVADPRSFADGLCGHRARHGLAAALPADRAAEKEALWRGVVAERPEFGPAWLGLGELLAASGRWADLWAAALAAEAAIPDDPAGVVLRARWHAGRGDYRGARQVLRAYCGRHPGAVLPRLALARVLLLEGRDRVAAERVLREVLAADPGNPEATRLLGLAGRWDRGDG